MNSGHFGVICNSCTTLSLVKRVQNVPCGFLPKGRNVQAANSLPFLWYYLKICLKNFAFANPIRDQGLTCELELSRKCLILISVYLNWRKSWLMWCFWILLNNIWCSESENNLSLQRKKRKKKKRSRDLGLNLKLICWNVLFGFFFYL